MLVHCCIDAQTPARTGPSVSLRGWLVGEAPIAALVAETEPGVCVAATYGHDRADVGAAFPAQHHARQAGFFLETTTPALAQPGHWWIQLATGAWHRLPVDWSRRQPQSAELGATTLQTTLPTAVAQALGQEQNIEDRVQRWLTRGPRLRLRLDLINKCNLRCIMCHYNNPAYAQKAVRKISLEEFQGFFDPIAPEVGEVLLSCADEPLLAPAFPGVLRYLAEKHPHVFVHFCTNAMLMDAPIRRLLVETGVGRVMVSLDGARRETFERIRKGARFDQVIRNIHALQALRTATGAIRPELQLNFVMMRSNLDEAPAVVEIARRLGASALDCHHAVPTNGIDLGQERLDFHPACYNHYRPQIERAAAAAGLRLYLPPAYATTEVHAATDEAAVGLDDFLEALRDSPTDAVAGLRPRPPTAPTADDALPFPKLFCEMPFREIFLANQDTIMPCPFHRTLHIARTAATNLREVFFSPPFAALRQAMLTPEGDAGCQGCPVVAQRLTLRPE